MDAGVAQQIADAALFTNLLRIEGQHLVENKQFVRGNRLADGERGDVAVEQGVGEVLEHGILFQAGIADDQVVPGNTDGDFVAILEQIVEQGQEVLHRFCDLRMLGRV